MKCRQVDCHAELVASSATSIAVSGLHDCHEELALQEVLPRSFVDEQVSLRHIGLVPCVGRRRGAGDDIGAYSFVIA